MINNPNECLAELKKLNAHLQRAVWEDDVKRYAAAFEKANGFTLEFKPFAIDALVEEANDRDLTNQSLCKGKIQRLQYGLNIIHRNTGQTVFKIGKLAIEDADKELSNGSYVVLSKLKIK